MIFLLGSTTTTAICYEEKLLQLTFKYLILRLSLTFRVPILKISLTAFLYNNSGDKKSEVTILHSIWQTSTARRSQNRNPGFMQDFFGSF